MIDLDTVTADFLQQCGLHDYGVTTACTCAEGDYRPVMHALVVEVGQLRGDLKRALADRAALVTAVTGLRELEDLWSQAKQAADVAPERVDDDVVYSVIVRDLSKLLDKIGATR